MTRTTVIFAILTLASGNLSLASELALCTDVRSGVELAQKWSREFVEGIVVESGSKVALGTGNRDIILAGEHEPPPDCPVERDCTGPIGNGNTCSTNPANCEVVGPRIRIDTGLAACTLPDDKIHQCPLGKTILIKEAACGHCPCCSTIPACLCPNDCGKVLRWGCE